MVCESSGRSTNGIYRWRNGNATHMHMDG
jgi:hypothetical protein